MTRVDSRRRPNAAERRHQLCDAAIALLAEEGPRGLSHLKVDRRAGVPDGTTSFYYRTRAALLQGVADHLARYDADAFAEAFDDVPDEAGDDLLRMLAEQVLLVRDEPHLSRVRARLELTMLAKGDAGIAAGFQQVSESYRLVTERLVTAMQHGRAAPLDRSLLDEQVSVVLTYLSGLVFAFANGSTEPMASHDIQRQIRAVVIGVAAERVSSTS
ncbi:TetR/AcrR family transcriptional regulator [Mycolicibacterium sp. jd]|uniref:TetR/AcrR family transcriptional regulator n=1 Tax=unclassified Mycolicibacterium TaxID=2636767 RepID=UPI00351ACF38